MDGVCPHRGGPLADGMLAGDQIVCPYHAFRYDSRSGVCGQGEQCSVVAYPVKISGGTVQVAVG